MCCVREVNFRVHRWYRQEDYVYKERESLITLARGVTPVSNIRDMFSKCGSINHTESGGKLAPRRITFIFARYAWFRAPREHHSLHIIAECPRDFTSLCRIGENFARKSLAHSRVNLTYIYVLYIAKSSEIFIALPFLDPPYKTVPARF